MAQITLSYDSKNSLAKKTLDYVLSLGIFKKVEPKSIDIALEEVRKGEVNKYASVEDFFKKVDS